MWPSLGHHDLAGLVHFAGEEGEKKLAGMERNTLIISASNFIIFLP